MWYNIWLFKTHPIFDLDDQTEHGKDAREQIHGRLVDETETGPAVERRRDVLEYSKVQ